LSNHLQLSLKEIEMTKKNILIDIIGAFLEVVVDLDVSRGE
jgi:hypothetical protein